MSRSTKWKSQGRGRLKQRIPPPGPRISQILVLLVRKKKNRWHGPVAHHGRSRWHTHAQCIEESVGSCLHNPASVTTVYAGGATSSSSRRLSLSLSLVRSFVTRQSHNVPALSSHARVDRIGKHILVCSPLPGILAPWFSWPSTLVPEHASEDETLPARCLWDRSCGSRMDQGWKRVFEFEMKGYVLSLIVEFTRNFLRSIVGGKKFVVFETKSIRISESSISKKW